MAPGFCAGYLSESGFRGLKDFQDSAFGVCGGRGGGQRVR